MKQTDIERILKQGSVKQKIKLYMTDVAYFNTNGLQTIDIKLLEKENILRSRDELLTDKEREILWNSIKEPKDIEYYNNLRTYNSAFLMFKDRLSVNLVRLQAIYYLILMEFTERLNRNEKFVLVESILDFIPDKKTRDKALNKANELRKGEKKLKDEIKENTELSIEYAKICKEYVIMFKTILANDLPLKPYKDWVEIQEQTLKGLIKLIHTITVNALTPPDFPKIELYDEIKAEITDEDIEDFKNAGI
jgi:hypothetical protein